MSEPPVHVVSPAALAAGHGVARYAAEVAADVGAATVDPAEVTSLAPSRLHVHVSERVLGGSPEAATAWLTAAAQRHEVTLTLHDVPQASDGTAFGRRRAAYAAILGLARGWVVSSHHEAGLVAEHLAPAGPGAVVPLPVRPRPVHRPSGPGAEPVIGVLGWVYPGKGHAEVIDAVRALPGRSGAVVRALGAASVGHDDLLALLDRAAGPDVRFGATGYLSEAALDAAIAAVDVPVAAHRHVSASGSINSWLAAGRRPLVVDGAYAREMATLRPGSLTLVDDAPGALGAAIASALAAPATTWLGADVDLRPGPAETAAAYRAWWAGVWP